MRPEAAETILRNSRAVINHDGSRAAYSPQLDRIIMPPASAFVSPQEWAVTALHELTHWTGHETRLNRQFGRKGTEDYAREELRAEAASVLMGGVLGLPLDLPNHGAYVGGYLKALKQDKRELFRALSDAQKAADLCLGFHPDYAIKLAADRKEQAEAGELRVAPRPQPRGRSARPS